MHTNITIHLSVGDHVGGDVTRLRDGSHVGVFHVDSGDQRLELRAEDPEVLYELATRIGALAGRLDADRKAQAVMASAGCRRALSGEWSA